MSAVGMTQTVLATGLVDAIRKSGLCAEASNEQILAPPVQAWIREVAQALIDAEGHVPIQPSGLRKDVAVEVMHDRSINPPRTNPGRRADDRR